MRLEPSGRRLWLGPILPGDADLDGGAPVLRIVMMAPLQSPSSHRAVKSWLTTAAFSGS